MPTISGALPVRQKAKRIQLTDKQKSVLLNEAVTSAPTSTTIPTSAPHAIPPPIENARLVPIFERAESREYSNGNEATMRNLPARFHTALKLDEVASPLPPPSPNPPSPPHAQSTPGRIRRLPSITGILEEAQNCRHYSKEARNARNPQLKLNIARTDMNQGLLTDLYLCVKAAVHRTPRNFDCTPDQRLEINAAFDTMIALRDNNVHFSRKVDKQVWAIQSWLGLICHVVTDEEWKEELRRKRARFMR